MNKLDEIVAGPDDNGVYPLLAGHEAHDFRVFCERKGLACLHINGNGVHNKEEFLGLASIALQFPDYFGQNWDAFDECVTNFEWLPADGYLILVSGVTEFARNSRDDFDTFGNNEGRC